MQHFKILQQVILCIVGIGFTSPLGCHNTVQQSLPVIPSIAASSKSTKPAPTYGDYLEHYPRNSPIEDIMEYVLQYGSSDFGDLRDSILKEKPKFRQMASACLNLPKVEDGRISDINYPMPDDGIVNTLLPAFLPPIQLEPGLYLIRLRCVRGIVINSYSFFIYSKQKGINPSALKLSVGSVSESREFYTYKTTEIFALTDGFVYDSNKRELQVNLRCNTSAGFLDSRTIYKYGNKNLSLLEYWQDDPNNDRCLRKPHLRQFYP